MVVVFGGASGVGTKSATGEEAESGRWLARGWTAGRCVLGIVGGAAMGIVVVGLMGLGNGLGEGVSGLDGDFVGAFLVEEHVFLWICLELFRFGWGWIGGRRWRRCWVFAEDVEVRSVENGFPRARKEMRIM